MAVFTEVKKGYDPTEVNNFIKQLNDSNSAIIAERDQKIKALEDEIKKLKKSSAPASTVKAEETDKDLEEAKKRYERLCSDMGEKLLLAEVKASEIVEDAEKKKEKIISDARIEANSDVKRILKEAEDNADKIKKASREFEKQVRDIQNALEAARDAVNGGLDKIKGNIYGE